MSTLAPFLAHLFDTGEAKLTERPDPDDGREVLALLRDAFHEYSLEVAGPGIDFEPRVAAAAALFTARACWFAISRQETPEEVAAYLPFLAEPATATAHLSIDLTFRYAVTVHRRVHAQNPEDVLAIRLAEALRRCPLTGVLAELFSPPAGDLTFAAHPGLELLYAERLAAHFRPAWLPPPGRTREAVEWVFQTQGKSLPPASGAASAAR